MHGRYGLVGLVGEVVSGSGQTEIIRIREKLEYVNKSSVCAPITCVIAFATNLSCFGLRVFWLVVVWSSQRSCELS